jgi:hypothetical protein
MLLSIRRNENMSARVLSYLIMVLMVSGTGCASNWQRFYQANPGTNGKTFAATDAAQVRTVEFERLSRFMEEENKRRAESNTAVEDVPLSERIQAKNRLLEVLRLKERNDDIAFLGWSEFDSPRNEDPKDGTLEQFAKSVGADYVMVASRYGGQSTQVVNMPITSYSSSNANAYLYGRNGYAGTANIYSSGTSTTWVPTPVARNHFVYTCMFFRKMRSGETPR